MEALIARAIQILLALGGAYMLTLWFALIVWTFQDIQSRSRSVVAQIFSTLTVVLFFIPGVLIYMILRPKETLDDVFQRSLEEEYLMQDLEELPLCPSCQQYVEEEWVFCPSCHTELRDNCVSCGHLIDLRWSLCPYCGAEQAPDGDIDVIEADEARPAIGAGTRPFPARQRRELPIARPLALENGRRRLLEQETVRIDFRTDTTNTEPARATETEDIAENAEVEPDRTERISFLGSLTRPPGVGATLHPREVSADVDPERAEAGDKAARSDGPAEIPIAWMPDSDPVPGDRFGAESIDAAVSGVSDRTDLQQSEMDDANVGELHASGGVDDGHLPDPSQPRTEGSETPQGAAENSKSLAQDLSIEHDLPPDARDEPASDDYRLASDLRLTKSHRSGEPPKTD